MPIVGRAAQGPSLTEKISLLKQQAEDGGRDPASISITMFGARPDLDQIRRMEEAGVNRVIFSLPSEERDAVLPIIDEYAKFI